MVVPIQFHRLIHFIHTYTSSQGESAPNPGKQMRHVAVTLHCPNGDRKPAAIVKAWAQEQGLTYVFQLERCGTTGKLHYQGFFSHKAAKTWKTWVNKFQAFWPGAHVQLMKTNINANLAYCSKLESRVVNADMGYLDEDIGPHWLGYQAQTALRLVTKTIVDPYPWQADLAAILATKPDERSIVWIHETEGNVGKSAFARDAAIDGRTLVFAGKANDAKSAVADWVAPLDKDKQPLPPKPLDAVILDVPRVSADYISYQALEEFKNGMFFSGKYASRMVVMPFIHVVVFSNEPPDTSKMSKDRWQVYRIVDKRLVKDTPVALGADALFHPGPQ